MSHAQTLSAGWRRTHRMDLNSGVDAGGIARLPAVGYKRQRACDLLLHLGHDQGAEGGPARACVHLGASIHRFVMARVEARRSALDHLGYRLGEGRVRRAVRSVDERRYDLYVQRPLRTEKAARLDATLSHHEFLRAANRVSDAGEGGPRAGSIAGAAALRRSR